MEKLLSKIFSLAIILAANVLPYVSAEKTFDIYVYCSYESSDSRALLEYLSSELKQNVIIYDVADQSNYGRFLELRRTLILSIEEQPQNQKGCEICLLNKYAKSYNLPIAGFFWEGKLAIITVGVTQPEAIEQLLNVNVGDGVLVVKNNQTYIITDETVKSKLERLFIEEGVNPPLTALISLALSDSINPCTFAVFTALLLITLNALGKNRTIVIGACFILAIFISYYALGLGLIQFFALTPNLDKIVSVIGVFIGVFNIVRGLRPNFKSPLPKIIRKFISSQIDKSFLSPIASFLLGLILSLTLLPCTGGPYLIGAILLAPLKSIQKYAYLALYNIIFVAPLIVILLLISLSAEYSRKIKTFRSSRLGAMEFASGLILVAVCLYILLQ